jgi:hypothetical protein
MTACDPATPIRERAPRPMWTVTRPDRPSCEGLQAIVRLCLDVARRRLAERARAADGEDGDHAHMEEST